MDEFLPVNIVKEQDISEWEKTQQFQNKYPGCKSRKIKYRKKTGPKQ